MHKYIYPLTFISLLLVSCGAGAANKTKSYLNYKYNLARCGDLHGLPPTSNEVLDRNKGFTSYINLFDREKSFINYQCKGTSYDDFYCEASFYLYDINDNPIICVDSFVCQYSGGQSGMIIYEDDNIKKQLGIIYVYTPYWCRWQCEYDIDNSGNEVLLTFEFWKGQFNSLPEFLKSK